MNRTIRSFFDQRGYLEVDTPLLSPTLIPESTIEVFETRFVNPFERSLELYLVPSPEVYMKRLIADGWGSLYQISHCFRNSEQLGRIHNPEFTMLEYYTIDADEQDSIAITEALFSALLKDSDAEHLRPPFARMSVAEAMKKWASVDLDQGPSQRDLAAHAQRLGLSFSGEPESWEETFNRIFLTFVEPNLPQDRPLVLERYPRQIECLAKADGLYRRRWELYGGGIELANCYYEERDQSTIEYYYKAEYARLVARRVESEGAIADVDPSLAAIMAQMPPTSGVALGLDRVQMLLMGLHDLTQVLPFPLASLIGER
jgi:lysyl-tRNA synthetase class 2